MKTINTTKTTKEPNSTMSDAAVERELTKADALLKDFDSVAVMVPSESEQDDAVFVHYNGLNIRFARDAVVNLRTPIVEILEQAGLRVLRMDAPPSAAMR